MHGCIGRLELIKKQIHVIHGRHMFSDKPYISKLFEINSCLFMLFHVACNHMSFSEVFSFQTETHPLSFDQYWLSSTLVFHISWYSKNSKTQILCVCFISVLLSNFKSSHFSNHFILFSTTNVDFGFVWNLMKWLCFDLHEDHFWFVSLNALVLDKPGWLGDYFSWKIVLHHLEDIGCMGQIFVHNAMN